jgi:hypothetical protein
MTADLHETITVTSGTRIRFLDAARGSAMFFVLIAHFSNSYFDAVHQRAAMMALMRVGMVATPTFTLISGLLVGFLHRTRPSDFDRIRTKLADRGLFLLTVAHLLIVIGCFPTIGTGRYVIITDVLGVSMIVGPWLVTRVQPNLRLLLSLGAFAASWMMVWLSHPSSTIGRLAQEGLFGSLDSTTVLLYAYPFIPWMSLDFAGSALGDKLGARFAKGDLAGMSRLLGGVAAASLITALAAMTGFLVLKIEFGATHFTFIRIVHTLVAPDQKWPPSPVYFLWQGGTGLALLSLWLWVERKGRLPRLLNRAAALGQTSLVMFVVQFYVYYALLRQARAHLPFAGAWPIYLLASMTLVVVPALLWHGRGFARFLTVGYRRSPGRPAAAPVGHRAALAAPPSR